MHAEKIIKSSQEQATASWINYLNQIRLDRLMDTLRKEQTNLDAALDTIDRTLKTISTDIVNRGKGRGGTTGMHGFIAEVAECGVGNARSQIEGKAPIYQWIDDNGPADLKRGATLIQQKFVNSGGHLSLQAIHKHLETYPDFLNEGGKYQIPADHYEKIKWLLSIPEEQAHKMPTSTGDFSLSQWKEVHAFFDAGDVPLNAVEPSDLGYADVQKNTYEGTLSKEKQSLRQTNKERRDQAYQKSKPSIQEGAKATVISAFVEGGMTLCLAIDKKRKTGKKISEFDINDWEGIAKKSGLGFAKGGTRGISIYMLTNYVATPAAVASSIVTASFSVAEQAHRLRQGDIDEVGFIDSSESLCLEAAISALSSFAGQTLIPVPVLGAVIGNAIGTAMLQIARDNLSGKEQKLFEGYLQEIKIQNSKLREKYRDTLEQIREQMIRFMAILERAFSPDIQMAFAGSIDLAREMGVPQEEILDSEEKLYSYFME